MARERSVSDVCEVVELGKAFRSELVYAPHVRYYRAIPVLTIYRWSDNLAKLATSVLYMHIIRPSPLLISIVTVIWSLVQ